MIQLERSDMLNGFNLHALSCNWLMLSYTSANYDKVGSFYFFKTQFICCTFLNVF